MPRRSYRLSRSSERWRSVKPTDARPTGHYHRKLDGEQEARLIALACSEPPGGQARWSLRLLADRMVELAVVEEISYQTVRRTLKKTSLSLI